MTPSRLLIPLTFLLVSPPAYACDVPSFDVANHLVLHYQDQAVRFTQGKGYAFFSEEDRRRSEPEWGLSIERSVVLRPKRGVAVRLVLIHASHLRGSGASNILLGLQCVAGKLREVFRLEEPIRRLSVLSERAFEVVLPVWEKGDAMASPSRVKIERYRWSRPLRGFHRVQVSQSALLKGPSSP